jgi:N6-adenosine-specific RNA methylase IME4
MAQDEFDALCASIAQGFNPQFPVLLFEGRILDGRHRYEAARKCGVAPTFQPWEGTDPYAYVLRTHEARRSWISQEQKYLVVKKLRGASDDLAIKQQVEAQRRAKMAQAKTGHVFAGNRHTGSVLVHGDQVDHHVPEPEPILTLAPLPRVAAQPAPAKKAEQPKKKPDAKAKDAATTSAKKAAVVGVSSAAVRRVEALERVRPDLADKVAAGELKMAQAQREAKRDAVRTAAGALPEGKFRVIYADPPWSYGDDRAGLTGYEKQAAAHSYPTMKTSDIAAMPVRDMASDDGVLFMWATFPLLVDAIEVIKGWGFQYKTAFVWHKPSSGFGGNYHKCNAELLMVATRGSGVPESKDRHPQVFAFPKPGDGRHSAKPEEVRAMIDAMYPTGPRVELFRRGDAPAGWVVWGNETTQEIDNVA